MEKILEQARKRGYKTMPIGKNPRVFLIGEPDIPSQEDLNYQSFLLREVLPEICLHHQDLDSIQRNWPCFIRRAGELETHILQLDKTNPNQIDDNQYSRTQKSDVRNAYEEQVIAEQIKAMSHLSLKPLVVVIKSRHLRDMSMIHPHLTDPSRSLSYLNIDQSGEYL